MKFCVHTDKRLRIGPHQFLIHLNDKSDPPLILSLLFCKKKLYVAKQHFRTAGSASIFMNPSVGAGGHVVFTNCFKC